MPIAVPIAIIFSVRLTRRGFLLGLGMVGASGIGVVVARSWMDQYSALRVGYTSNLSPTKTLSLDAYDMAVGLIWAQATADRLTHGKATVRHQLEALERWTHDNVRPQYAAPQVVIQDNFYNVARRGFGYCDQLAHLLATLASLSGHDSRLLFLRRADGSSPHTVTEVRVDNSWVLVDPWIGAVLHDEADRMVTVEDVMQRPKILTKFAYDTVGITADLFGRGVPYRTFPYDNVGDFVDRIDRKLTGADNLPTTGSHATQSQTQLSAAGSTGRTAEPSREQMAVEAVAYDNARRAHLEGRYSDAIAGYTTILRSAIDPDLAKASRFHLGLAYLSGGKVELSKTAFDLALVFDPGSEWAPSSLFFRAEARARLGDHRGSVLDLRSANIPPATARLRALHRQL